MDSIVKYDNIFLGYPNWWGTMPMAVFTFLERYDFSDKRVIPFCTNEGSGMGRSVLDLEKVCNGATVLDGLPVRGAEAGDLEEKISVWAKRSLLK